MAHLYLHFPFCLYKCLYCDFNSYAIDRSRLDEGAYINALKAELLGREQIFQKTGHHFFTPQTKLKTLFLGGGTPSLLSALALESILSDLQKYFIIDHHTEITLECNPGTVTKQNLIDFKKAGITRLSLGVQSLHEAYLSSFGRIHTANQAREVIGWIQDVQFKSWSCDLIFGFPGQTRDEWEKDLLEVISFNAPHLSCYSFTVEKEAPYAKLVAQKKAQLPEEDTQAEMFLLTREQLTKANYTQYETSNFCKPGFESRHNLAYWNYQEYLALGAGGVSQWHDKKSDGTLNKVIRTTNKKLPQEYSKSALNMEEQEVNKNSLWLNYEEIDAKTAMGEFMMMGLRLKQGIDEAHFKKLFKSLFKNSVEQIYAPQLATLRAQGLIEKNKVAVTPQGALVANQIISEFF